MTTPAAQLIRQQILRHGPMTFNEFVELALYHPVHGYYNRKAPQRGRGGDYFTSPQVSPLFAKILARGILAMQETIGSDQFSLIEVGAGDGEFMRGVLDCLESEKKLRGLRIVVVERGTGAREKCRKTLSRFPRAEVVSSLDEVEQVGGLEGCLFTNEFFDALPFHRLRYHESGWKEICVGLDGEQLIEVEIMPTLPPPPNPTDERDIQFVEGQEVELRPQVESVYEQWGALLSRGYTLAFDYGFPRAHLQSPARMKGTWLCYHKHRANQNIFEHIGEQDITAHVDFTQLTSAGRGYGFEPMLFATQGIFLTHLGQTIIPEWLQEGPPAAHAKKAAALQQLLHPDAMGETFKVLAQAKGVPMPPLFAEMPNRLRRLEATGVEQD